VAQLSGSWQINALPREISMPSKLFRTQRARRLWHFGYPRYIPSIAKFVVIPG
jgi:hypothetical protein